MVATRRSGANSAPVPHVPPRPSKRRKVTVSGTAEQPGKPLTIQSLISQNSSMSTNSTAPKRPSSELSELTLTSPSIGRTSHHSQPTRLDQPRQVSTNPSTEQVMAVLKKFTTLGSSHNPIVLLDNSSPPKVRQTPKDHNKVEPHMFQDRHSKLYTYKTPRPALEPRPTNRSTLTGHPSHDMYRMRTAKMAAPGWHVSGHQQTQPDLPFEMQFPIAARYLGPQVCTAYPPARTDLQYFPPPSPSYSPYAASVPLNEGLLRSKALQYVREYSRSSPRKRKIAGDPDETSESDSTEADLDTTLPLCPSRFTLMASGNAKLRSGPVTILPDPHFQLTPLIEQASLLTSLLRVYPRSTDQKGLREDIAMLASMQNQHLADWLNFEVGQSRKLASQHTPRVSRSQAISSTKPAIPYLTAGELAAAEQKRRQDNEIRGLLSANAKVWQDGSGLSVADVFSDDQASTPAEGQNDVVEPQDEGAIVSTLSPARCIAGTPTTVPNIAITASSPPSKPSTQPIVKSMPKVVATASSPVVAPRACRLATPSPKVASVATSPVLGTSGRKRMAPARFRTEQGE